MSTSIEAVLACTDVLLRSLGVPVVPKHCEMGSKRETK